jgi:hypothetical protein
MELTIVIISGNQANHSTKDQSFGRETDRRHVQGYGGQARNPRVKDGDEQCEA